MQDAVRRILMLNSDPGELFEFEAKRLKRGSWLASEF